MVHPAPRRPSSVATTVLHHQLITVEWDANGEQPLRPPWFGTVVQLHLRLQATRERLPFRVVTTGPARAAAAPFGTREAHLLGARAALHTWLTVPPPHTASLKVDHPAVSWLIQQVSDENAQGLLRQLLQALARINPSLPLDPVGAALGTGLPFDQCRDLLFQMERNGQLSVYAEHYRLNVPPEPVPEPPGPRDLPTPSFHALTSDPQLADLLEARWIEAEFLASTPAHRMALIAYGAVLEGALLAAVLNDLRTANTQGATPKDRQGNVKPAASWTLTELIQMAEQAGWLHTARGTLGHVVRDFRNYVHPREELRQRTPIDLGVVRVAREAVWFSLQDLARARTPEDPA